MPRDIIFGEIDGIPEDHWFEGRREMMSSSFHRNWAMGIDGNGAEGASAIVLSGGYEDDEDHGDEIIYTGAGGNNQSTGKQIEDQSWDNTGNAGLLKSMDEGLPVRVIRGRQHKSEFSPDTGYKYAGLFTVTDAWLEVGKSAFKICRFRLLYCGQNDNRKTPEEVELSYVRKKGERKEGVVVRIIRDTKISRDIKKIYNGRCQVCGITIKTKSGNYSEGAHIRPLGRPHDGDDATDNLLSLCPNHHVMLDKGVISISNDFELLGEESGSLTLHQEHRIHLMNLNYHRKIHGYD